MELRRKLWDGLLPLKINLALSDLNSLETPRSLYMMAPRENYFFYILNEVKTLFDSYAPQDKLEAYDEMWFEFNNVPLKWNIPIGVQFDSIIGLKKKQKDLPWCLVFHYRGFPEEQILKLEGMNFFRFHYINALKESHCLRLGTANEILSTLTQKDETRMIEGLLKHNYESFWEINQQLCDKHIAEMKKYAIRIFTNRHHTYVQANFEIKHNLIHSSSNMSNGQILNQSQTPPQQQDEVLGEIDDPSKVTIGDVLEDTFPRLFEKSLNDKGELELVKKRDFEVIIQGVEVNLDTPIYWMQLNMSYLDNYLYICLHFD